MIDYTKTRWGILERNPLRMIPKPTVFLYPEENIAVIERLMFGDKPAIQDRVRIDETFETKLDALKSIEKDLVEKLNYLNSKLAKIELLKTRIEFIRQEIEKENG
jgi:hypothetical protein